MQAAEGLTALTPTAISRGCEVGSPINAGHEPRPEAPGRQGMLPYPRPLSTGQERCPSPGSRPCGWLAMSLGGGLRTPPRHPPAVVLARGPACVFGRAVGIVNRRAVVAQPLTEPTPTGWGLSTAFAVVCEGPGLLAPWDPLGPVGLAGWVPRRRLPAARGGSGEREVVRPEAVGRCVRPAPLAVADGPAVPVSAPRR
jgi:hypothetical protein